MENSIAPLIEVRSANERGDSSKRSAKSFAVAESPRLIQSITTRCAPTPDHSTKLTPMRPIRPARIVLRTRESEMAAA
jgi:hypothetical protein